MDEWLVKMFNPTLERRQTILFFLIVVIYGLICIDWILGQIQVTTKTHTKSIKGLIDFEKTQVEEYIS